RLDSGTGSRLLVSNGQSPTQLRARCRDGDQRLLDHTLVVSMLDSLLAEGREGVCALLGNFGEAIMKILRCSAHDQRGLVDQPLCDDPGVRVNALSHGMSAHMLDAAG